MPITVEMCVAGRDLTEPRPSPDGTLVATVVRWGPTAAIVVVPVEGGPERILTTSPPPTPGRGLGGGCFDWVPATGAAPPAIVYTSGGALWWQPVGPGEPRRVVDHGEDASVRAPSVVVLHDADVAGAGGPGAGVAYVVDEAQVWWAPLAAALDGSRDAPLGASLDAPGLLVRIDDGSADFCFDPHAAPVDPPDPGTPGGASAVTVRWQAWRVPDMPWDTAHVEIAHIAVDGTVVARDRRRGPGAIQQPRSAGGVDVEVRDDTGWLNLWWDDRPLVDEPHEHAGPTWGPGQRSYAVAPDRGRIAFTRNEAGFGRLCVVDVATGEVETVARGVHGQLGWAGDHLVALRTGARTPTQVVAHRVPSGATTGWERRTLLVGPVAAWDHLGPDELPEPEPFRVDVGGGVVHGRRYAAGSGRMLCWIHGGPTDQWQVEFMPRVAHWVAQGWDVVAPDPRGSTGHGRSYQQALRGEWGRLDVDDTAAVIRHAHDAGWADPATTVVIGGSSGGLTVLGVLGLHPGLAAGGVASYPVCDLADLAERSHRFEAHYTLSLVGPLADVDRYRERSPLTYADRIAGPLLVLHGDADPVVPVEQSIALADRVRSAGGDVELVLFEGEGHGFRDPANKRAEYARVGAFLDRVVPDSSRTRPR